MAVVSWCCPVRRFHGKTGKWVYALNILATIMGLYKISGGILSEATAMGLCFATAGLAAAVVAYRYAFSTPVGSKYQPVSTPASSNGLEMA